MTDKAQRGPHPVPDNEDKAAAKRAYGKSEPNTHLERRQERNSELTEQTANDPQTTPKPHPADH